MIVEKGKDMSSYLDPQPRVCLIFIRTLSLSVGDKNEPKLFTGQMDPRPVNKPKTGNVNFRALHPCTLSSPDTSFASVFLGILVLLLLLESLDNSFSQGFSTVQF